MPKQHFVAYQSIDSAYNWAPRHSRNRIRIDQLKVGDVIIYHASQLQDPKDTPMRAGYSATVTRIELDPTKARHRIVHLTTGALKSMNHSSSVELNLAESPNTDEPYVGRGKRTTIDGIGID